MLHNLFILNAISVMAALTNEQDNNKNNKLAVNNSQCSVNLKLFCLGLLIVNFIAAAGYFYFKKSKSKVTIEVCDVENTEKEIAEKFIETLLETIDAFKEINEDVSEADTFRDKVAEFINALKEKKIFNISLIKKVSAAKFTVEDELNTHLETLKALEDQIQRVYDFAVNKERDPDGIKKALSFLVHQFKNKKEELDSILNQLGKRDKMAINVRIISNSSYKRIKEMVPEIYQIIEPGLTIAEKIAALKGIEFEMQNIYLLVKSKARSHFGIKIKLYDTLAEFKITKIKLYMLIEHLEKDEYFVNAAHNAVNSVNHVVESLLPEIKHYIEQNSALSKKVSKLITDIQYIENELLKLDLMVKSDINLPIYIFNALEKELKNFRSVKTQLKALQNEIDYNT